MEFFTAHPRSESRPARYACLMVKIGYIVGSLAADSVNRKLAGVIVEQSPERAQLVEVPIAELPLYDRHLDDDFPQVLTDFKEQVADVEGAADSATTRQATKYIEAFTSFVEA